MLRELFFYLLCGAIGSAMVVERVRQARGVKKIFDWSSTDLVAFFVMIPLGFFNFLVLVIVIVVTTTRR